MKNFSLGIIGCGNMAQAIIKGVSFGGADKFLAENNAALNIIVSDKNQSQLDRINEQKIEKVMTTTDNNYLVKNCDYILFAVKPQNFKEVVSGLDLENKVIISIMAGVKIDKIKALTKAEKIARIMPNLNAKIGKSFSSFTYADLDSAEEAFICALMASIGGYIKVPERDFSAATAMAGSGPAYVFMFVKAFVEAAKSYGFSDDASFKIALETIMGSAENILQSGSAGNIDNLIDSVCSKGGTTIEGVNFLKENAFENLVKDAIEKGFLRAKELELE